MAEAILQKMVRNSITTPSTVAGNLTLTTSTLGTRGMDGFGLVVTTAIPAEILVDPDDKVGFVVMVSNSSTFTNATLTLEAGEGWQGASKEFTIAANSDSARMYFLGPFESAKYVRYDSTTITGGSGKPHVTFTLTTGTAGPAPTCNIVAFNFPTVAYAT